MYLPYADENYFHYVEFGKSYEFGVKITDSEGQEFTESLEVKWETPAIELSCEHASEDTFDCKVEASEDQASFFKENCFIQWQYMP